MARTTLVSRRRFLVGLTVIPAAFLAACGGSSGNNSADATLQAVAGKTPAASSAAASTAPAASAAPSASGAPSGAGASAAPAQSAGLLKTVPRNRTLIFANNGNQLTDYNVMNPFLTGLATGDGYPWVYEAPYYYNSYATDTVCGPTGYPCKDGFIPWQLESYEANADFTQYTLHVRKGVAWSDGQPFTAKDIAFTINMLKNNSDKMTWGIDMKTWVNSSFR